MEIYFEIDDKYGQGQIFENLGVVSSYLKNFEECKSYYKKALEIFVQSKYNHLVVHVLKNAKILADASGDDGVLKEMVEILAAHFSKEELRELLNSPPDS